MPIIDLKYNSYYIAGITEDHVYLGNITAPFDLIITNKALTDSQHVKISIKGIENATVFKSATVKIKPPYFFLTDGLRPAIYRGVLGKWEAERIDYDSTAYFKQIAPLGPNSFTILAAAYPTLQNALGKEKLDSPRVELNKSLLQKQIDGIFCTDGMLAYNTDLNRMIYTYYYRNEFIVADTNMILDYRGQTLDTISKAQIKIGHVSSDNTTKLLDKTTTNLKTCTRGKYLYINSNLLAKNDGKDWLDNNSIIDVYDLTTNTYRFSFTIPRYEGTKARDFMVSDDVLIVLYDHHMAKFDLQPNYL
jgi:hypothetical protein